MVELIGLDDDETKHKEEDPKGVEDPMDVCADTFLVAAGGGLNDKDGLDDEEDASGVEELDIC